MNAITGIENLIAQPSILNCPYWAAYADRYGEGNKVRDNYPIKKGRGEDGEPDGTTIEDAERTLRRFVGDLSYSGCNLVFWFSDSPRPSKGGYRISFYLPAQTGAQSSVNGIGAIPQPPAVDIEKTIDERVNAHIERFMAEQEKRNLLNRIKELETQLKETDSPLDRVIGRLEPFINPILDNMFNTKAAVSTANVGAASTDPNKDQAIAEKALTELSEIEPDLPTLLAKLAKLAKEDPGTYNMAKMFLNK